MLDPGWLPNTMQRNTSVSWDGCWLWMRSTQEGYGATSVKGERWLTHRYSYSVYYGAIPAGMVLDHLCRNRRCLNPEHLEPVTIAENVHRGLRAQQTHCKRGHEYTTANTYLYRPTSEGGISRKCLACRRERHAQNKEKKTND